MATLPTECRLCPRECGADRAAGKRGVCGAADELRVARAALHEWEEPPISAGAGSGAVFFSHCPLRCVYCQNEDIACGEAGIDISVGRLANIFLESAARGAVNINLVTPGHYALQIIEAVKRARQSGLSIPVIWNTSGYESERTIDLLAGTVDVYLADFKYAPDAESDAARRYSHAPDYFECATRALDAMVSQAGSPSFTSPSAGEPVMASGVIVRHLLLPGHLGDSRFVLEHVWRRYGDGVLYSIMNQYTPLRAFPDAPELGAPPTDDEYESLLDFVDSLGMEDYFWQQGGAAKESFIPAFDGSGVLPR